MLDDPPARRHDVPLGACELEPCDAPRVGGQEAGVFTGCSRRAQEDAAAVQHEHSSYLKCLSMSLLAGLSTTLGAAVVLLVPGNQVPPPQMAFILALAGSVMLSASLLEFWIPAVANGGFSQLGEILLYSGAGAAMFFVFSMLIPEHHHAGDKVSPRPEDDALELGETADLVGRASPSARSSGGSSSTSASSSRLDAVTYGKGSAGGQTPTFHGEEECGAPAVKATAEEEDSVARRWRLAMVLMMSLTAHNFPEGMAVAISALDDVRLGGVVMVAIAIHNIPEGIAISVPVLSATGSRWQAVWMTLLSGIAEPLGACVALLLTTLNGAPTQQSMEKLLCAVGGVMSAVSLKELLPEAWRLRQPKEFAAGCIAGFVIMLVTKHFGA